MVTLPAKKKYEDLNLFDRHLMDRSSSPFKGFKLIQINRFRNVTD